MIYAYSVILFAILLAQFGAGITAFVMKGDLTDGIETKMVDGMDNYGGEDYGGVTDTWDFVQQELQCCGVNNYTDWGRVDGWMQGVVPNSCCKVGPSFEVDAIINFDKFQVESDGCGNVGFFPDAIFTVGCLGIVSDLFVANISIVGGNGSLYPTSTTSRACERYSRNLNVFMDKQTDRLYCLGTTGLYLLKFRFWSIGLDFRNSGLWIFYRLYHV